MSDALDEPIIERELSPGRTWLVRIRDDGRRLVYKRLPDDCLKDDQLHPAVRLRLSRLRELPLGPFVNLVGVERHEAFGVVMISEYAEGQPLDDLPAADRARLQRELHLVVQSMHQLGMVHGGIHGCNVIWNPATGRLCLIDPSPLLHDDPAVDLRALDRLEQPSQTASAPAEPPGRDPEAALRQRTLIAAVALVVLAIGAAVGIGHYLVQ